MRLPRLLIEIIIVTIISLLCIPLFRSFNAEAAPGDHAVYRDSTDDTTIAQSPSTTYITWDSSEDIGSVYSLQGNNYDIQLGESGHYFVSYSVHTQQDGGSNRTDSIGWLELDGTDSTYGYSGGYIRRHSGNGAEEGYNQGAAIILADSGDMINVEIQKRDNNSGATSRQRADKAGISLLKLKDSWNYVRLYRNTNSSDVSGWTSFTDIDWEVSDELDTGSFDWSSNTADEITIKGFAGDHFLVTSNVSLYQYASSNTRQNYETRLALDGSGIEGTTTTAYIRGDQNSNGTYSAVTSFAGIITKQSSSDEILTLQLRRESTGAGASTRMVASETAISIVKIPNLADYIRLADYDGSQDLTTSRSAITWDTVREEDSSFTHNSTFTSRIDLNMTGDFLVLSTAYTDRTADGVDREQPFLEWRVDGSDLLEYGGHGSYNRGLQGNYSNTSGSSGGGIINNLATAQYIELTQINEATNDDSYYTAGGLAMQVVRVDSLFLPPIPFTSQKHFRWRDDTVALDSTAGWLDVEDSNDNVGEIERNENVRLRIEVANIGNDVESAARAYELQWGEKNGSCAGVSTWTGVIDSSDEFEMYDSSNYTDGDSTTTGVLTNSEGYTFTNGEGKDTGDTTSNIGPMNDSIYTELEYSIRPTSSVSYGSTYCFRLYDQNNSEVLDDYAVFPELTIGTPSVDQLHYRWRNDTVILDSTGGWITTEDTNPATATLVGADVRLRMEVANTGTHDGSGSETYELQWGLKSTTCSAISVWTGVADASDDFDMLSSTYIEPDGTATTTSVLANSEGYTFTNGEGRDVADTTGSIGPLGDGYFTEIEYSFEPTANTTTGATYCFRLYDTTAGAALDNYAVYPEMTIVNPHTAQMHFRWRDDSSDLNPTLPTDTVGEIGQVTTDGTGTNVQFSTTYTNPVVIAESITGDDTGGSTNRPAAAMITYVDGTGFNVRIQETDSENDDHGNETFGWMVMEEGSWTLDNGTQIDAGVESLTSSEYWNGGTAHDCNYTQSFSSAPAVLSALQTNNNTGSVDFLNTMVLNTTTADFDCYIVIEDTGSGTPTSGEDLGWIAIDQGTGTENNLDYEAGDTGINVNGWSDTPWYNQSFTQSFSTAPILIVTRNAGNGGDEGWMRYDNLTSSDFDVAIDENDDSDRSHGVTDSAYYLAWESSGDLIMEVDGSAGWLAEEDTDLSSTITKGETYRLRIEVANSGDYVEGVTRTYELQWGEKVSTCASVDTWIGVGDTDDAIEMVATTHIDPDGESTTKGILSNSEGYTRVNGEGRDVSDTTGTIGPLDAAEYTELEYSIRATDNAVTGGVYCFRLYDDNNSTELDSYKVYPELQIDYEVIDSDGLMMEWDTQSGVTDDGWTDISFRGSYTNPVFVCTPEYSNNQGNESDGDDDSIVCRVQNVTSTGAQIRLQEPGAPGSLTESETVHWMVAEDGTYDTTDVKMEAFTYTSTVTDTSSSWVGQSQSLGQTYTNPVAVGSVTTYNDPNYTAFWSHDGSRGAATSTNFYAGKHVAEDPTTSRSDETISVIVFEETNDTINGVDYEAQLQGQTIARVDNSHTNYTFNQSFSSTPEVALASITGMSGTNGGHIVLYDEGSGVVSSTNIYLVTMEEEINDTEMSGNTEYGPYVVFETAGSSFIALDQTDYQWFDNNNGVQPGSQQVAENTATTDVEVNEVIRLRMSVQAGLGNLKANDRSFKLQYGQGSDCSAIGSWVDVDGTGGSGIWRGYDNNSPADGADITSSLLNNNNNVLQSYEEENNSVTNPNAVTEGGRGEWDWVVQNNGATAETDYCFRMATSDGDPLNYYRYPQLTTSPVAYTQNDFEWFVTADSVNLSNAWPPGNGVDLNENEALTQLPASNEPLINGDQIRVQLSFTTSKSNLDPSTQNFRLEYTAANDCTTAGGWSQVGAKGSGSIWRLFNESSIGDSTVQTNQISTSDTGSEGYYSEISPTAVNPNAVNVAETSEWDWPIENNGAAENTTYCFRMTLGDGTTLDNYNADSYPKLTTAPGTSDLLRHGNYYKDQQEQGYFWAN